MVTINEDGKGSPISKLILSILTTISEMGRNQIRERQLEGVKLGKEGCIYKSRLQESLEGVNQFLLKHKNEKCVSCKFIR